ncbi:GntR family transcriptional regulator [Clostridia bacterium]|nr:GntR family transcriptional regulator [Clostridia bacterium]
MMKLRKAKPLYIQVRDLLVQNIMSMEPGNNRLPSEEELTKQLGVSRSTVREAMHDLILQGVVSKRHGKGNYAHPAVLKVPYRIDYDPDFRSLLNDPDKTLSIKASPYSTAPASEKMVKRLPSAAGEEVYRWDWEYYLDDTLFVIATEEIPKKYFLREPQDSDEFSVKEFVANYCDKDLAYFISWINASERPQVAARFGVSQTIIQDWEEVYHDIEDHAICYCEVYFNPECLEVALLTSL